MAAEPRTGVGNWTNKEMEMVVKARIALYKGKATNDEGEQRMRGAEVSFHDKASLATEQQKFFLFLGGSSSRKGDKVSGVYSKLFNLHSMFQNTPPEDLPRRDEPLKGYTFAQRDFVDGNQVLMNELFGVIHEHEKVSSTLPRIRSFQSTPSSTSSAGPPPPQSFNNPPQSSSSAEIRQDVRQEDLIRNAEC